MNRQTSLVSQTKTKKKKKKIECCHLQEGIELLEFNFVNVCAIYTKAQVSERKKKD